MKQGFYQITMVTADAHKTAFTAPSGCYQYKRMAIGLRDAPITFSRAMALEIYLDDIMIFAENLEEHGKKFRRLVKRLENANLSVEPKKCQFLKREAHVLGYIVESGKMQTDPKDLVIRILFMLK